MKKTMERSIPSRILIIVGLVLVIILAVLVACLLAIERDCGLDASHQREREYSLGGGGGPRDEYTPGERAAIEKAACARQRLESLPVQANDLPCTLPYRPREGRKAHALHIGQRKLLLSEVDFLTDFARGGDTVVYAGAAPGIHIPLLAELFRRKRLKFVLYDPHKFIKMKSDRIVAHREFFTEDTALKYAGRDDVLFVSDIRTGGAEGGPPPSEETVQKDMTMQERWVLEMNPRVAMLKFRLRWHDSANRKYMYLRGEMRLQAWAPTTSTEARLVVARPYSRRTAYVPDRYNNRMYYLNSVVREWVTFQHNVPLSQVAGLDYCYDCSREAHIWAKYLGKRATPEKIAALFNRATKAIHRSLDKPPHGIRPRELPVLKRGLTDC